MKIPIKFHKPFEIVQAIAFNLKTKVVEDCSEYSTTLSGKEGEGVFRTFHFQDELTLFIFDGYLNTDLFLEYSGNEESIMLFTYSIKGGVNNHINDSGLQYLLNPLRASMTLVPPGTKNMFHIPKGKKNVFTQLILSRDAFLEKLDCEIDKIPEVFSDNFDLKEEKTPSYHLSNYSATIAGCIDKILNNEETDVVRATYIEAQTLKLLSLHLSLYLDGDNEHLKTGLKEQDIEKISEARKILLKNLHDSVTIPDLAKRVGINQQKLKSGFKELYGITIANYKREERLEKARRLLLKNNKSIREIAYEVGYSNASHFTKWFKKRFDVYPKDYLKSLKDNHRASGKNKL